MTDSQGSSKEQTIDEVIDFARKANLPVIDRLIAEIEHLRSTHEPAPEWQTICAQLRDWVHHLISCAIYSLPRKPCDCGLQTILDRASALTKGDGQS